MVDARLDGTEDVDPSGDGQEDATKLKDLRAKVDPLLFREISLAAERRGYGTVTDAVREVMTVWARSDAVEAAIVAAPAGLRRPELPASLNPIETR